MNVPVHKMLKIAARVKWMRRLCVRPVYSITGMIKAAGKEKDRCT